MDAKQIIHRHTAKIDPASQKTETKVKESV
jgi:hypothetical protein